MKVAWMAHSAKRCGQVPESQSPTKGKAKAKKAQTKVQDQALTNQSSAMAAAGKNPDVRGWQYDMIGHSKGVVEYYCKIAAIKPEALRAVKPPSLDDHEINPSDLEAKGNLAAEAASIVLKAFYTARMNRPDIYYSVNVLARDVTRWTQACDRRLLKLISYIHTTRHWVLKSMVGDSLEDLRLRSIPMLPLPTS